MTASKLTGLLFLAMIVVALTSPLSAQEQPASAATDSAASLGEAENREAYHYTSAEGNFQVTWPAGCGKLRIRANEPEEFVGEDNSQVILVHLVVCDRYGEMGDGCSVMATFESRQPDGSPAGPEQVMARVRHALKTYDVKVVDQAPIRREFADGLVVEGIDVRGTRRTGEGQFWVRGLLSYHDIYMLTAWSMDGEIWDDPEYLAFFNEFVPYAE